MEINRPRRRRKKKGLNRYEKTFPKFVKYLRTRNERVKSTRLEWLFDLKGSEVRKLVRMARQAGVPVASGAKGYEIVSDYQDIRSTIKQLVSRAHDLMATVKALKKKFHRGRGRI